MRVEINIELAPKGNLIDNIKRVPTSFKQRISHFNSSPKYGSPLSSLSQDPVMKKNVRILGFMQILPYLNSPTIP